MDIQTYTIRVKQDGKFFFAQSVSLCICIQYYSTTKNFFGRLTLSPRDLICHLY